MKKQMTDAERIALQREKVKEHIHLECTNQWDKVYDTFKGTDEIYYEIAPGGDVRRGRQGIIDFYTDLHTTFPDLVYTVHHQYDVPGYSITEGTSTGTHLGPFGDIPASGHKVQFDCIAIFIFDEEEPDKILAERAYWDNDSLIRQMKGEPMPTLGHLENFRR